MEREEAMILHEISEILPGHLYLGPFPDASICSELEDRGVNAVLSIIHPTDELVIPSALKERFAWNNVAIKDSFFKGVPSVAQLGQAVEILKTWRREGRVIYIHCREGRGRSPLVAMAYLVMGNEEEPAPREHRLSYAIFRVKKSRPIADPNVHQLLNLCKYVEQYYPLDVVFA